MNLSTLRKRLVRHQEHRNGAGPVNDRDSAPAMKDLTRLLGAHHRVLLVLDRFDDLAAVLGWFVSRAAGARVDVVALVVLPEWSAGMLERGTRARLKRIATDVSSSDVRISADVRLGEPVATVLEAADRHDADLITMTIHPVGVLDRLLDRSILEEVLRMSPVPVVAIGG